MSVTSFFKFQHSPTLVTSFLTFQLLPSVCCQVVHFVTSVLTFHLVYKPPSLLLPLRFTSYASYNLFVTLILSSIRCNSFLSFLIYFLPFVSTLPFRSAVPLVSTLNSFLSFVTVFLSFQLSPFIRYFIPFVSTLTSRSLLTYCFPSFQVVHCWPWSKTFPTWMIRTKAFNLTMIKFISPLRLKNMIRIEPKVLEIW